MNTYLGCNEHQDADIRLQGVAVKRVKTFTYLGSSWRRMDNWMRKSPTECRAGGRTGRVSEVLCDRKINVKIKGKVYRTVVRPALMFGAETWALKKAQEKKLEVAEIRMLRWVCGYEARSWTIIIKKKGDNESGGNHKESTGKKVEVVWACDEKRGILRRKEGDGNEGTGEKEEKET